MSETEIVAKLVDAIAKQLRPAIPVAIDLWDVATIAQYLKRDDQVVRERIACLPDFPKAIRLPTMSGTRSRPLWKAMEVIDWVEKYREIKTKS